MTVLGDALLYLLQHAEDFLLQLRLVPLHRLAPHERVLVGHGLHLRAVDVLHVKAQHPLLHQMLHNLDEQSVDLVFHVPAAEAVNRAVRRVLVA